MKKTLKSLALVGVIYGLPLLHRLFLMLNPYVLVAAAAGAVLLLSQPELSAAETRADRAADRLSLLSIVVAGIVGSVVPVILWSVRHAERHHRLPGALELAGLGLMIGGLAFRIWSIRVLGRFFTATVRIRDDHRVVSDGPYRVVRHPSYLGALAAIVGAPLWLGVPEAAAVAGVLMLAAYVQRISAEETALNAALGAEYALYADGRSRLFPFVW